MGPVGKILLPARQFGQLHHLLLEMICLHFVPNKKIGNK